LAYTFAEILGEWPFWVLLSRYSTRNLQKAGDIMVDVKKRKMPLLVMAIFAILGRKIARHHLVGDLVPHTKLDCCRQIGLEHRETFQQLQIVLFIPDSG
jgi:hypothetical protein